MRIDTIVSDVIEQIKTDKFFSNISVIKAYPCNIKPTRVTKEIVAVGLDEISFDNAFTDENDKAGEITVFLDIFIPITMDNSRAGEIFSNICRCLKNYCISAIASKRVQTHRDTSSFILKTTITFRGLLSFGGDNIE